MDALETIKSKIRNIPDFPMPGILFRDLTTVFKDAICLQELGVALSDLYQDHQITKVVGIESRGFIMGPVMANRLNAGFVTLRKPGKLPADTYQEFYSKEYGDDCIEIHRDAIDSCDVVLIHDDLLATGGTMSTAYRLVQRFHPKKIYINCIVELEELGGRSHLPAGIEVQTLIRF